MSGLNNMIAVDPTIIGMAVRYAIGRRSYASTAMANEVRRLAPDLPLRVCYWILEDIAEAIEGSKINEIDYRSWYHARNELLARLMEFKDYNGYYHKQAAKDAVA